MREITSCSFALEDVFCLYLQPSPGFFVDIGCSHPVVGNNSKLLEMNGWSGICIDRDPHPAWCDHRTTPCHRLDATTLDYGALFEGVRAPQLIDALSIDVDDASLAVLLKVTAAPPRYRIILIEHDFYRTPALRSGEREHLAGLGYELVCSEVMHEPGKPFEDWWLDPQCFDSGLIEQIRSDSELDIEIIRKFGLATCIRRDYGFAGSYPQIEYA